MNNIISQKEGTFYSILDYTDEYLFILSINKDKNSKIIKYSIEKKDFIDFYSIDKIFDQIIIKDDILYFIQYKKILLSC